MKHNGKVAAGSGQRHKNRLFGTQNSTEVITQVGAMAHLPCEVLPVGAGVVSMIDIGWARVL